jgi:hypothetical protein
MEGLKAIAREALETFEAISKVASALVVGIY